MKVKKYFASDMRNGIRMIREDLGEDAVILANRKVAGGLELTATVEYAQAVTARKKPKLASPVRISPESELDDLDPVTEQRAKALDKALAAARDRLIQSEMKSDTEEMPVSHLQTARDQQVTADPAQAAGYQPEVGQNSARTDSSMLSMQAELRTMRNLISQCFGNIALEKMETRDPAQAVILDRLVRMGLEGAFARSFLAEQKMLEGDDTNWRNALARLE